MNFGLALLPAILGAMLPPGVLAQTEPPATAEIYATIDGFNVTSPYLQRFMEDHYARRLMESLVRARVIEHEAIARGISLSHDEITGKLDRQEGRFSSLDEYAWHIEQLGYTMKGYREHVRTEMLLDALLDKAAGIDDEKVRAYYEQHLSEFSTETQLHILHIATRDQPEALAVFRALVDGTPFEVVARRFSLPGRPGADGDLGWVTRDTIPVPGLWDVARALEEGDTAEPFEMDGVYHIVRLAGVRPGGALSFEQVQADIRYRLHSEAGLSREDFVTRLLAAADIRIYWAPVSYMQQDYAMLRHIRVAVDGRPLRLDPAPFISDRGIMMVPAKQVLQSIGAIVTWEPAAKTLSIQRGATIATVAMGETAAMVDGQAVSLEAAPAVRDEVLFVPLRGIANLFGFSIKWNAVTKLAAVDTRGNGTDR